MLVINVLFWVVLALDAAAVAVFFFLGLAAAGPSKTNPLSVIGTMLILPGAVLVALAVWFLAIKAPVSRVAALAIAASPLLFVVAGQLMTSIAMLRNPEEAKIPMAFKPMSVAPFESAILANDVNAITQAATSNSLRGKQEGGGLILLALRRIEKSPEQLPLLRALLDAGADPNGGYGEKPLEVAIRVSPKAGKEPIEMLLKAGANPNALNSLGEPLYFAALVNTVELEVLQMLLDRGANPQTKSYSGETALARAYAKNNPKAAALLAKP
jgi:ankyrin repeat protein